MATPARRLVLVFFLVARGRLRAPLLYLSDYLEADRQRYYDSLRAIQQRGDAVPWISLFLTSVETQAADAVVRAEQLLHLRETYREEAAGLGTPNALALVDLICESPVVTSRLVEERLGVSRPTALRLLRRLEECRVLSESERGIGGSATTLRARCWPWWPVRGGPARVMSPRLLAVAPR